MAKDVNAVPRQILAIDERLYSVRLKEREGNIFAVSVGYDSAPDVQTKLQKEEQFEITNDDLTDTEKNQLVNARRGQGLFRARVELLEPGCRVTGVTDRAHLRASHIKPWCLADNSERLDGHNGLLLAPHIDHLFDRGFISFADDGKILISASTEIGRTTGMGDFGQSIFRIIHCKATRLYGISPTERVSFGLRSHFSV